MTSDLIDAHVHVWDPGLHDYGWLAGTNEERPLLPSDHRRSGAVSGAVFVQAADGPTDPIVEARWAAGLDWPELLGIVAAADLGAPVERIAVQLDELSRIPRVVGVRHLLQDLPVAAFPALVPGLQMLAESGLAFDACIRHEQLPALVALVDAVPDLRVVLDHCAKPPIDDGVGSEVGLAWAAGVRELAARPNAAVKLSGLAPESSDRDAFERNVGGFLAHVLDVFGPERCLFGSDWPVSERFGVGEGVVAWHDRVRAVVPTEHWPAVAATSARRWYRLRSR